MSVVSATVKDPNGVPWSSAQYAFTFVPGQIAPNLYTGESVASKSGSLDSTGSFSGVVLGDVNILGGGARWLFTVTSATGQSFTTLVEPTGATPSLSTVLSAASPVLSGAALVSQTLSVAAQATLRLVDSELLLNYAGTTTISGSVTAVRGCSTVASGTTLASGGNVYGTQGKLICPGTLVLGSGFACGVLAQLDISAITAHTSGYLAPLICDVGASVASGLTTDANLNGIFISNNTACKMNAAIKANIKASAVLDLSDSQGDYSWYTTVVGAVGAYYLRIIINGTAYKLGPLYADS